MLAQTSVHSARLREMVDSIHLNQAPGLAACHCGLRLYFELEHGQSVASFADSVLLGPRHPSCHDHKVSTMGHIRPVLSQMFAHNTSLLPGLNVCTAKNYSGRPKSRARTVYKCKLHREGFSKSFFGGSRSNIPTRVGAIGPNEAAWCDPAPQLALRLAGGNNSNQ